MRNSDDAARRRRVKYAEAGAAQRQSWRRALDARMRGQDYRLLGFIYSKTTSYSRLAEWVSVVEMSEATGISSRHVSESLVRLVEAGCIWRDKSRTGRPSLVGVSEAIQQDLPVGGHASAEARLQEGMAPKGEVGLPAGGEEGMPADGQTFEKFSEKTSRRRGLERAKNGAPSRAARIMDDCHVCERQTEHLETGDSPPRCVECAARAMDDEVTTREVAQR